MGNYPFVSVIIPTKNAENTIEKCLQAVFNQQLCDVEVIIIDSGSTDNTLEIIERYPVLVRKIPSYCFSHGFARNLGAELAKGEILVYLNQDAVPVGNLWLKNLLEPLKQEDMAASYARQIPYPHTNPVEKYFVLKTYPPTPRVLTIKDLYQHSPENIVLLSTVSAAVKKDLWRKFQFNNDIIMSEDQELAARFLKSGYKIFYQARAIVFHSHNYTTLDALKRYFDSGWSMQLLGVNSLDIRKTIRYSVDLVRGTLKFVLCQTETNRLYWAFFSVNYILAKCAGFALGLRCEYFPRILRKRLSYTLHKLRSL